jgi:hypothetical protein
VEESVGSKENISDEDLPLPELEANLVAGVASCAHGLSWRLGFSLIAAREKVRVARAFEDLPSGARLATVGHAAAPVAPARGRPGRGQHPLAG